MSTLASPVALAFVAMLAWGLWTALADAATESVPPEVAMIVSYVVSIAVATAYVVGADRPVELAGQGVALAAVAGVFAGIGAIAFYAALAGGRTGVVTTISAMYFVVAGLLGVVFLGDSLGLRQVVGIGLAAVAVALLAT